MPQTRTIVQEVYQFDELSDAAKEKARDWYREASCGDTSDFDCVIEDFQRVAEIIGVDISTHEVKLMNGNTRRAPDIWWSGFCSQGDGACFEGGYSHTEDSCAKIREHAPQDAELHRIADELARIQAGRILLGQPVVSATMKHRGNYYHANSVDFDVDDVNNDGTCDSAVAEAVAELMRDLMRWLYKQLDQQNDHLNSDAYIDETIEANEYEFDEDGGRL